MIKILERLVSFNTIDDKENSQIMNWLFDYLKNIGFNVELLVDESNGKKNLFAFFDNQVDDTVYFSGHTDTVPDSDNWTKNPFELLVDGDKLYGLGTCDMKGGIAAFLSAISKTNLKEVKKNIGVILTYGEEIKFEGVIDLFKQKRFIPGLVIVAEPTDLEPIIASKGVSDVKITFIGKEAHGSTPDKGINAIEMMSEFVVELKKCFPEIANEKVDIFNPPQATLNIALVKGGDAINKVPQKCYLNIEYRTVKSGQDIIIFNEIKNIIKRLNINAEISNPLSMQPMIAEKTDNINQIEIITGKKVSGANYITEANFFNDVGMKVVILGPGPINPHEADEYVSLASLEKTEKIFQQIILN